MGEHFGKGDLNSQDFSDLLDIELTTKYHGAWILEAKTKRGKMEPIGLVLGFWPHPELAFAPYMLVGGIAWFPWASKRNMIESAVNFFNRIRNEIPMQGYALIAHKKIYEIMCMHGIMRRIGTSMTAIPGHAAATFETRVTQ